MKRIILSLLILGLFAIAHADSSSQGYYIRNDFLMTSSSVFQEGLLGFANPANLAHIESGDIRFHWSTEGTDGWSLENWGAFAAAPHVGIGALHQEFGPYGVTDYQFALGFGNGMVSSGIAYRWSTGDDDEIGREKLLSFSSIHRFNRYLLLGLIGTLSLDSKWNEAVAELGIRPLGTPLVTLFGDGAIEKGVKLEDALWSAGAAIEPVPGISLTGRYFENESFTVGLNFELGTGGIGGQSYFDSEQDVSRYSYSIRAGGRRHSFMPKLVQKDKKFLPIPLKGEVRYNKFILFDDDTHRLADVLLDIKAAVKDPRVAAIVMNLSGMQALPEHIWEIREELRQARESGITVFVFFDMAEMSEYHLASVADYVIMDPEGLMVLPGYVRGRTYFKGALAKLGLGFDEWRFYEYKSAVEVLSRDSMSDADEEQRQDYVDAIYELVRAEVCQSRGLSQDKYDEYIDNKMLFSPSDAVRAGLVDTLARWSDKDAIIKELLGRKLAGLDRDDLFANALPQRNWGPLPKVAVVYGIGECAMDSGIKGRRLEKVFLRLEKDNSVKAVLFRVDSPGGDGTASDLVAQALKKCAEKKPVIVSQGQVAASGGYWISMYGDTIVAAPNSITGSIGVIGGWLYDKSFSYKLGMTSDYVKRGEHAEVGFGVTLPFIGMTVPARNLTDAERSIIENTIRGFYDGFVHKVAAGRDLPVDSVRKIAEGHWYAGTRGQEIGLVDEIGGMMAALEIARSAAGINPDQEIELVEIPKSIGLFNFGERLSPIQSDVKQNPVYQYIKMVSDNPGKPLPMLLPGDYPALEQ